MQGISELERSYSNEPLDGQFKTSYRNTEDAQIQADILKKAIN